VRRSLLLVVLAAMPAIAALAQSKVSSPAPDDISLTIYRDNIALVTETRRIDLPAGQVTVVLEGVLESLLPQSAVIHGTGRVLAETNYHFDRLTPASLLRRSVGKTVTLVRTSPRTGVSSRLEAVIESAGTGVVLRMVDGQEALQCSGLPEKLEFAELPAELGAKPVLSVDLAAGEPGPRTVTVSYLAHGFAFTADYVARLNSESTRADLSGWATLSNETGSGFRNAQVQLVAGRLNVLPAEEGGSRSPPPDRYTYPGEIDEETGLPPTPQDLLREEEEAEVQQQLWRLGECWPQGKSWDGMEIPQNLLARMDVVTGGASAVYVDSESLQEVVVTGSRVMSRENLGDYQLYRLPWRTDLNARQTKQVAFLHKEKVRSRRVYQVAVGHFEAEETVPDEAIDVVLKWKNERSDGLGEPLPGGMVRIFETGDGAQVFVGEASMGDSPVGQEIQLRIGRALDLTAEFGIDSWEVDESDRNSPVRVRALHRFVSSKQAPVTIEVRRNLSDGVFASPRIMSSSMRSRREKGELVWRFRLPGGAERSLRYELEAEPLDD